MVVSDKMTIVSEYFEFLDEFLSTIKKFYPKEEKRVEVYRNLVSVAFRTNGRKTIGKVTDLLRIFQNDIDTRDDTRFLTLSREGILETIEEHDVDVSEQGFELIDLVRENWKSKETTSDIKECIWTFLEVLLTKGVEISFA